MTRDEFRPCKLVLNDSCMTIFLYEDVACVAKPVIDGKPHYVDWLVSFDGRLVGIQFWRVFPEDAP